MGVFGRKCAPDHDFWRPIIRSLIGRGIVKEGAERSGAGSS